MRKAPFCLFYDVDIKRKADFCTKGINLLVRHF